MTKQEYLLKLYIVETFKEMGVKFLNNETKEDDTKETVKEILKDKDFREKIIDKFSDIIINEFKINY